MPCRAHSSVIVHSCDNHCSTNCFRFSTAPLTFQGMLLCSRLRERTKLSTMSPVCFVNYPPGLHPKSFPDEGVRGSHILTEAFHEQGLEDGPGKLPQ